MTVCACLGTLKTSKASAASTTREFFLESFHWDPCFLTGLPTVDEQHQRLVDLINRFGTVLVRPQGAGADEIEQLLTQLLAYAKVHFQDEEALMAAACISPAYVRRHHQEHARFLLDLTQLHDAAQGQAQSEGRALLSYLINWLAYHILGSDQLMAWMMTTAHTGASAEEAYRAFQKDKDPATAMLLQALDELFNQVSASNRALRALNQNLEARVQERTHALQRANEQLQHIAMTDALTGLANRRQALLALEGAWTTSADDHAWLTCMMIDADGFKQINDTQGHDAGDEVLRQLARRLAGALRTDDTVFRLGGDEFMVLCAATPLPSALLLAEKLRREVADLHISVNGGAGMWHGSISVGVAVRTRDMARPEQLLKVADEGVYKAKHQGRNAVATVQVQHG